MSNRPIPRKGLLGCWFLDDRGIAYNAGANEAKDRSGRGNHATYQNGVTVGVEGDPAREFGASDFDAGSNQYVDVGDALALAGAKATVAIFKPENLNGTNQQIASNQNTNQGDSILIDDFDRLLYVVKDGSGDGNAIILPSINEDEYICAVGAVSDGNNSLFVGGELQGADSIESFNPAENNFNIGRAEFIGNHFDGEIAAVARYDLTVPNAPEPSEIARKWDKLRDIPATR